MDNARTIDITPHWPGMFRVGEQLIKEADFNGKEFVLEIYQFGSRCYDEIQRLEEARDTVAKVKGE